MELNPGRDVKGNRKGFYRYISSKRKLLLNGAGEMVTNDTEDAQDLSAYQ